MKNREELETKIFEMYKILFYAKESFLYAKYLYKPETSIEYEFIEESEQLRFIRYSIFRMLIIELAKLYSRGNSDDFCINKFLKYINSNEYWGLRSFRIVNSKWNQNLTEKANIIDQVYKLRNKNYAHSDLIKLNIANGPSFEELWSLIELAEEIIRKSALELLGINLEIQALSTFKEPFNMIKILARENADRIKKN